MKNNSRVTFNELARNINWVRVIWNDKVIYDDENLSTNKKLLNKLYERYGNRFVYSMQVNVVDIHHVELNVKGENKFTSRIYVMQEYKDRDLYCAYLTDTKELNSKVAAFEIINEPTIVRDVKETYKLASNLKSDLPGYSVVRVLLKEPLNAKWYNPGNPVYICIEQK